VGWKEETVLERGPDGRRCNMIGMLQWLHSRYTMLRGDRERGAAAVEYGLLVGLIAIAVIGALIALGGQISGFFEAVVEVLSNTEPADPGTT
jgi:pilus assembly protein Flp/PilA